VAAGIYGDDAAADVDGDDVFAEAKPGTKPHVRKTSSSWYGRTHAYFRYDGHMPRKR
jgi:hypothetical protein